MHPRNYIPTNKQKTYTPRKLATANLNDSNVLHIPMLYKRFCINVLSACFE